MKTTTTRLIPTKRPGERSLRERWNRLLRRLLGAISSVVDDSPGWMPHDHGPHERDPGEAARLYADALDAWRTDPLAWRVVALVRDHVLGDGLHLASPIPTLDDFIRAFWYHRLNQVEMRLPALVDELTRSGDLFLLLFRNPADGMSYLRPLTRDEITHIETAPDDRETEWVYWQNIPGHPGERQPWYSPYHPKAAASNAICLHYAVNRPAGALFGESDLSPLLPWLETYRAMLQDRARMHRGLHTFLWFLTVPLGRHKEKAAAYSLPPAPGSVVIKDEAEQWEAVTPNLHAADARHDLDAMFRQICAGAGMPGHWLGDQETANLATARASQAPAERALKRRQGYLLYILQDLIYHAYSRAVQVGKATPLDTADYSRLFRARAADISREDNLHLAQAAETMGRAMASAQGYAANQTAFRRTALEMVFQAAGAPLDETDMGTLTTVP